MDCVVSMWGRGPGGHGRGQLDRGGACQGDKRAGVLRGPGWQGGQRGFGPEATEAWVAAGQAAMG